MSIFLNIYIDEKYVYKVLPIKNKYHKNTYNLVGNNNFGGVSI